MMRMTSVVAALAMMVAMAGPARAGSVGGTWGPIAGYGVALDEFTQQTTTFDVTDGTVSVYYDPDPDEPWLSSGAISLDLGSSGYTFFANQEMSEGIDGDEITFSAMYGLGGSISASFLGDPSDASSWQLVSVTKSPPYHGDDWVDIWFWDGPAAASAVPEPSSGLLLAAGLAGVGLLGRRRRARPA